MPRYNNVNKIHTAFCSYQDKTIDKGKSFTIEIGRNICGKNSANDIVFSDTEILPNMHFSVVYEPKQNEFFITPDKGAVFLNNEFLDRPAVLKSDDRILVGSTELVFVPFCNKNRSWNEWNEF